ncbi:MarR family winged helix-turn-helix transcriptional regulator [Caenibacillus caldisaponilyticus]|mgnify:CR=1 FL=1|uniref:MarR family winged helix-turn-helix transcriptional regulator n=1 Tax=Caenibacillus caldisaponilyticus TaxID=1674942 RepID=UPI000988506C|nr:MarR family transcriptional regulator [Caenibacillus caldisaponilyticus]
MNESKTALKETYAAIEKELRVVASVIKETGRQLLKDVGITPPQFVALQWIAEEEGITIGELSARVYMPFSTTTDMIDRLEEKGLVKRVKDERDKRLVRIHLQAKGSELIRAVIRKRQDFLAEKLEGLSAEDLRAFQAGLDHLYQEIKKDL